MACICCFFSNEHQTSLKQSLMGLPVFEDFLNAYKCAFLSEIAKLQSVSTCACSQSERIRTSPNCVAFCDDFFDELVTKGPSIEKTFEKIFCIYRKSLTSRSNAESDMDTFRSSNTIDSTVMMTNQIQPLYRARRAHGCDPNNIYELFHIPFSHRGSISEARFSVAGEPMLYLAASVSTALAELQSNVSEAHIAAFLRKPGPKDYSFYDAVNFLDVTLNEIIVSVSSQVPLDYNDPINSPNRLTLKRDLDGTILFQIMTIPRRTAGTDGIAEYILPQLFTHSAYIQRKAGIIYQSTKPNGFQATDQTKHLDYNFCYFVDSNQPGDYDQTLLDNFYWACLPSSACNKTFTDLNDLVTKTVNKCDSLPQSRKHSFYFPIKGLLKNLSALKTVVLRDGKRYSDTKEGLYETNLLYALAEKIYIDM